MTPCPASYGQRPASCIPPGLGSPRPRALAALTLAVLAGAVACSDDPTGARDLTEVADLTFAVDTLHLLESEEVRIEVTLRNADGDPLAGDAAVEWESSDPSVVTVDEDGLARGEAPGEAEVRALADDVRKSLPVTVEEAPNLKLASVEPDTLREGETATLRGTGLDERSLRVAIAGLEAEILEASPEAATVEVPRICRPTGETRVEISLLDGRIARSTDHPNAGGEPLGMEPGEFRLVTDPRDFCLNFQSTDREERYALGVQSASSSASSLTPARLSVRAAGEPVAEEVAAAPGGAERSGPRPTTAEAPETRAAPADRRAPEMGDHWARHYRAEEEVRDRDREYLRRLLGGGRGSHEDASLETTPQAASSAPGSVPADVQRGDTVDIRVPDLDSNNICRNFRPIRTVAREVGDNGVWLEDVENPSAEAFDDEDWSALSQGFEDHTHPTLADHFGEPTDFGENGRVAVVVTEAVNGFSLSLLGFVTSVDFFPREGDDGESCASSDVGEYFYTRAPDAGFDRERALEDFPRLVAHETTHIIQLGRRIDSDAAAPQEVWEVEGGAVLAEELAGHSATGRAPRQDHGVDVVFNDGDEERGPTDWYITGFSDLFRYFGLRQGGRQLDRVAAAPEECSWLARNVEGEHGAPCEMFRREPYGVAWSFLRWVADHFHAELPDGEASLHQGLIESPTRGFESVEELTGESREVLLAQWAASLYGDGRLPEDAHPRIAMPSWDLAGISAGIVEEARLDPERRSFSSFAETMEVRAGSSAYFVLEDEGRPAASVRVRGTEGDVLPDVMQLWVVRVR